MGQCPDRDRLSEMGLQELTAHIRTGDTLVAGQVLGEPTHLLEELFGAVGGIADLRLFVGMSLTDVFRRAPSNVALLSSVGMSPNAELIATGRMGLVPCHMSELPWLITEGPLKVDVALVRASPPDPDGYCSLGVVSDYAWHAVQSARVVLAELNHNVPVVKGDTRVHESQLTASIVSDRALPEYLVAAPSSLEMAIGRNVASYVHDGSCMQVGIGRLGEAVLRSIADRRDLGIHSGMVGDTFIEMVQAGIVTNARKRIDQGLSVAGSILGSAKALSLWAEDPCLRLRSISHTHALSTVEMLDDFVCVNSALEVDLLGQVNAEYAGDRYVGAIGGSVDFLRASVKAPGGHSIVALPSSTGNGRPRIVPLVRHATATRSDVDVIATEHGVAELRGATTSQRAGRIIAIAAPEQRETLKLAARKMGL